MAKTQTHKLVHAPGIPAVKRAIDAQLSEFCSGYILVAFEEKTGNPIIVQNLPKAETAIAVNVLLNTLVCQGGVRVGQA
jgi:hypothetical protein